MLQQLIDKKEQLIGTPTASNSSKVQEEDESNTLGGTQVDQEERKIPLVFDVQRTVVSIAKRFYDLIGVLAWFIVRFKVVSAVVKLKLDVGSAHYRRSFGTLKHSGC